MTTATVHLARHGLVENPTGLLYGRLPGYHLSELGRQMADRLGDYFADTRLNHLRCSPLERAQETMAPIAANYPDLSVHTDGRVIESANDLEGFVVNTKAVLRHPRLLWLFRNPLRPTWGESYRDIVARMREAIKDAAEAAGDGGQALIVSHQLPIWMARCDAEGRRLVHDPRKRECTVASVTTFHLIDGHVTSVSYTEPAADLLPSKAKTKSKAFVAGA